MNRIPLTVQEISLSLARARKETTKRLDQKGFGAFASSHEILGVLDEEFDEFREAVHDASEGANGRRVDELYDIAVACIIGAASIKAGRTDW